MIPVEASVTSLSTWSLRGLDVVEKVVSNESWSPACKELAFRQEALLFGPARVFCKCWVSSVCTEDHSAWPLASFEMAWLIPGSVSGNLALFAWLPYIYGSAVDFPTTKRRISPGVLLRGIGRDDKTSWDVVTFSQKRIIQCWGIAMMDFLKI